MAKKTKTKTKRRKRRLFTTKFSPKQVTVHETSLSPGYTLSLISDFKIRAWNFVFIFHRVQAERLGKFLDYPKFCLLGLGQTPNFSWDTKLDELSSWSLLSSSEFVCLVRSTRSIRLKQTDRTSDDRFGDKRRSSHVTNQTIKLKICSIMYI